MWALTAKSWDCSKTSAPKNDVIGLILAGGQARRMGGADKAFLKLGRETLIERAVARARPQVDELIINANGDLKRFASLACEVIPDRFGGFLGPLAGILSGFEWMRANRADARWLASFACDCPFFPTDMVARLIAEAQERNVQVAVAASGERHHPVFAVWSASLPVTSESVLHTEGLRKMDDFVAGFPNTRIAFSSASVDPFFNINTLDDLALAETLIR
jgi:molybdenum cofactor guanylyltransferase